jgi:chromosome segregation ATPase
VIKSQIADLEHRFRLVQEEKNRMDADAKERQDLQFRKSNALQENLKRSNMALTDIEAEIRDQTRKLDEQKVLIESRNEEIIRLRKTLSDLADEGERIQRAKNSLELELKDAHEDHRTVERQVSDFVEESEQLRKVKAVEENRMREAEAEVEQLRRRLREIQAMSGAAEQEHAQKVREIDEASQFQRYTQGEIDTLTVKNRQLQDDNEILGKKMEELEGQLRLANRKLDDVSRLVDEKEKELKSARTGSAQASGQELATREELRKFRQENENLQTLLDKYKNDAQFHKRLREEEANAKLKLEEEKQRLSREARVKEAEAQNARRELERYQDSHGQLLEERMMTAQELEALKEHASLLESQNENVIIV